MIADPPLGLNRNPGFLKLWAAQSVSVVGTSITQLALPTAAILGLHATPFEVGALAGLQRLPFLFFSLPAGAWLDRVPRRPVMIACDVGRALVLASIPVAAALGQLTLWQLYAAAFLVGSLTVFFDVGYLAFLPALVPRTDLLGGNQRLQFSYSLADLVGPGLAGLLIQAVGAARAITGNSLTFLFSAVMLLWIKAEPRGVEHPPARFRDLVAEGLRWVFRDPVLRSQLIGLTLGGYGFFFALPVLLVFVYRVLHLTPGLAGILFVAEGLATLAGLALAARVVRRLRLGPTMWISQVGMGIGLMILPAAVLAPIPLLVAGLIVLGFSESIQNVEQVTIRQTLTPPRLQARMNACFRLFYWGSWPLASFSGGAVAGWVGSGETIFIGGLLTVAAALYIALTPLGRLAERSTAELSPDLS